MLFSQYLAYSTITCVFTKKGPSVCRYAPLQPPDFPKCNHITKSYRCATLKMSDIATFHRDFYATKDKQLQDAFLARYCKTIACKRRRPKNQVYNPKTFTTKCFVRVKADLVPVCQTAFLNILHIKKHRLQFVMRNYVMTGKSPSERRGGDHISFKFKNKREAVINFIKRFKCVEAHYTRSSTTIRRYLPSELNIKKISQMYNSETEDPNLKVKENFFRSIFNKSFNLGFGTPRTDVCSTCLSLDEKIKNNINADEKNKHIIEKRVHKLRANAFYTLLRQTRDDLLTISFDCQKNQVLPKVPDQNAYYSRQLYIYNLCFVEGSSRGKQTKENTFMYVWTENQFSKGSNEISSALFHRLSQTKLEGVTTLRLVCDGCGGQNKNCIIVATCAKWFLTAPVHLNSIEIIYPVTGHSFLPSDRIFGRIEQQLKRKEVIASPEEYEKVFANFGTVIRMGINCDVADWKQEAYRIFKGTASWHFKFSVTKRIILNRAKNGMNVLIRGEPHYRNDLGQAKSVCKPAKNINMINPDVIEMGVPVNNLKLRDVKKLLVKHWGEDWEKVDNLQFFKNIFQNDESTVAPDEEIIEGEIDCSEELPDLVV